MKKLLAKLKPIAPIFFIWAASIILVGLWSVRNLPFTPTFPYYEDLAAGYSRAEASFSHFDGIHYLRLIKKGYDDTGSQAFFPVYPLVIRTLSLGIIDPLIVAVAANILFLVVTLYIVSLNLKEKLLKRFVILFLSFPASFFFLTNYTESLFVMLIALFFHYSRGKRYFLAALVAGLASSTRLVGIFLSLSLLIELIKGRKNLLYSVSLFLTSISGLILYIAFLSYRFNDPLMFFHVQTMFNNGRSGEGIILLPQVIYRYLKMFMTVDRGSLLYLRVVWEFLTFVLSLLGLWIYRKKISLSAMFFCVSAIILPTLSGTFSSFPRYLLVAVPLFIAVSENLSSRLFWALVIVQYGILITVTALFVQGIFIA